MKSQITRRKLAEAAAAQFLRRGFAGTSLAVIAEGIGLTKGAFAYHFRAKSDLVDYFLEITRAAVAQAETFSAQVRPDLGLERLVLQQITLSRWQLNDACFAAGAALVIDRASPMFADPTIVMTSRRAAETAFALADDQGRRDPQISPARAADFFIAAIFGQIGFPQQLLVERQDPRHHVFLRHALVGSGVTDGHGVVQSVIDEHGDQFPALEYPDGY